MRIRKLIDISKDRLVYQGGHHNVYCDGEKHITTEGGTAGFLRQPTEGIGIMMREPFKCDCHKYEKARNAHD